MNIPFPSLRTFAPIITGDLRSLALFRILLGAIVFVDLFNVLGDLEAFYSDYGVLPRAHYLHYWASPTHLSVHLMNGELWFQRFIYLLAAAAAILLLLGVRPRTMALVLWFFLLSAHKRNHLVVYGGDVLLRALLLLGAFLPLGGRFALGSRSDSQGTSAIDFRSFPFFVYLVQLLCVYHFTGLLKWYDHAWRSGMGTYYALSWGQYRTQLGELVLDLPMSFLVGMNNAALAAEIFLPFVVLIPWKTALFRIIAIASMWALHVGILILMEVGLFSIISMIAWVPLIPSVFWDKLASKGFGHEIFSQQPQQEICSRLNSTLSGLAAAVALATILSWNLISVYPTWRSVLMPAPIAHIGRFFGLDQGWRLFAPTNYTDGWISIAAARSDRSLEDIFIGRPVFSSDPPDRISQSFKSVRWAKFWSNMLVRSKKRSRYLRNYGNFLCRRSWVNDPPGRRLEALQMIYFRRMIRPDRMRSEPEKFLLWQHECTKGTFEKWRPMLPFEEIPYKRGK